jgi:hypothetical protein
MIDEEIRKKIAKIQEANNFPSLARLTYLVDQEHSEIYPSQVKTFLRDDINTQLFKKQYRKITDSHICARFVNERVQMDIMEFTRY